MNRKIPVSLLLCTVLGACASQGKPVTACKTLCSTHEEGYQWAQSANLTDARGCNGNYPEAFLDGCRDGVEDLYQLRRATRSL
ncbi:MAG TPA: hypothetical protein VLI06_15150 [Solimonas sp.]|nr:hypothetical protein [Solimonas sp.]